MWVAILMVILIVIFFLCLFTWFVSPNELATTKGTKNSFVENAKDIILYVIGLLFKQGNIKICYCNIAIINKFFTESVGYPLRKTLPILLMAGAWGLASFLMANYYTSLLISYVAAPNPQPLIRSIFELRNRPELNVVTDKNTNIDTTISVHFKLLFFFCDN